MTTPNNPNRVPVVSPYGDFGTIDADKVQDAVSNGGFRLATPTEARLGKARPDYIPDAEAPKWDQLQDDEERYGGVRGALKSAGLGAARSATFGLSDEFLVKSGIMKPEELRGYKETNPVSTGVGEVGGVLGALLMPEGEVLGAAAAPVKGVAELGSAATEAAAAAMPAATSTVGKILSQGAAHAAGSAVEGAVYGLGQSISEHALGDPSLNGEKVISNVMTSALMGGALGGVLGGGAVAVPEGINAAKNAVGKLGDTVAGILPENAAARLSGAISGKSAQDIAPLLAEPFTEEGAAMRKSALEGFKEREETARELTDHLKTASDTLNSSVRDYYGAARPEEISKLMSQVPFEGSFNTAVDLSGKLKSEIAAMRAEPEIYSATGHIRKLEVVSEGLERNLSDAKSAEDIYHAVNDAKGQVQALAKYEGIPTQAERDTISRIKGIASDFKAHLENPAVYGDAGARQSALNDAYSDFAKASKDMLAKFGRKVASTGRREVDAGKVMSYLNQVGRPAGDTGHEILQQYIESAQRLTSQMAETNKNAISQVNTSKLMDLFEKTQAHAAGAESELEAVNQYKRLKEFGDNGGLNGAAAVGIGSHMLGLPTAPLEAAYGVYHTLKHPAELVRTLSRVERAVMAMDRAVDKGVKGIFEVSKSIRPLQSYAVASAATGPSMDDHDHVRGELAELSNNPGKLIDRLEKTTAGIAPHAPGTAQSVQGTMIRATQFLNSKMPPTPDMGPFSGKYKPSDAELSKWRNYFSVIENPAGALEQVRAGTLTADTVETLGAVYPKLYAEMQQKIFDQLTEHTAKKRAPIPFARQLTLSLFMGQDLTPALKPTTMLANQNVLSTATMQKKLTDAIQSGRISQKGAAAVDKASQVMTASQASAQRAQA